MHTFRVVIAAFTMTAGMLGSAVPGAAGQDDKHPSLPAGEGRDVMIRVCSQCHEAEKVVGQENDERGWKELVDQMASNGAQATDEELAAIVKYLAKAFPAK
jgi:mono/diheme cytochrome c family protein